MPPQSDPVPVDILPEGSPFLRRLLIATLTLLLLVLICYLLDKFRTIFQPLFIGLLITYSIRPLHQWLVRRGIPTFVAYAIILVLLLLALVGIGALGYSNYRDFTQNLEGYEKKLDVLVHDAIKKMPIEVPEEWRVREVDLTRYLSAQQLMGVFGAAIGTFFDFFTWLAITFVYLVFLIIEKETFPARIRRAFGDLQGEHISKVIESINDGVAQYIGVKTLVSLIAAITSLVVLVGFGVDFAITWALLIFLFNYIPYLGSLVATGLPIVLSLVQLGLWQAVVIAILLIAIQQLIGVFLEPRLAGRRLGVSPLLILLSLAFWGVLWGIVGMILAVPMLVILKIILDTIKETRPIATLMSNV
jgi:predicted PurR-regulated permease PerM